MKWEFQSMTLGQLRSATVIENLNILGSKDWELVSVDGGVAYFKRATEEILPAIVVVYSDHSQQAQEIASEIRRHLRTDL